MKLAVVVLLAAAIAVSGCIGQGPIDDGKIKINTTSELKLPKLVVKSGIVQLAANSSSGWKSALNNSRLRDGARVRTLDNSKAEIIFFDSTATRLAENTEILLKSSSKKLVEIFQSSGRTWNRIIRLAGIEEYKVQTPTAVAVVRGTAFTIDVDNDTVILVKDGTVNVSSYEIEEDGNLIFLDSEFVYENEWIEVDFEDADIEELFLPPRYEEVSGDSYEEGGPLPLAAEAYYERFDPEFYELLDWNSENEFEDEFFIDGIVDEYHEDYRDEFGDLTPEELELLEQFVEGEIEMEFLSEQGLLEEAIAEELLYEEDFIEGEIYIEDLQALGLEDAVIEDLVEGDVTIDELIDQGVIDEFFIEELIYEEEFAQAFPEEVPPEELSPKKN